MEIQPDIFNLPPRTRLRLISNNQIGIEKLIKSRIIQKDAAKIVAMAKQIKGVQPSTEVFLICTNNICSKSLALLQQEGIPVIIEEL